MAKPFGGSAREHGDDPDVPPSLIIFYRSHLGSLGKVDAAFHLAAESFSNKRMRSESIRTAGSPCLDYHAVSLGIPCSQ